MISVEDVLGPSGRIARRLPHFEQRPQQLEMALKVFEALFEGRRLLAEAGTGVGKSFAYLVPAILHAAAGSVDAKGDEVALAQKRVVISTHTISLQEQLLAKDVPFLRSVLPIEFTAVLCKGRNHYLSLRRLQGAMERSNNLFNSQEEVDQLKRIGDWAKQGGDRTRAELSERPLPVVWDEIASDSGNCMGRKCPRYADCHFYQAKRRAQNAHILIVNHALFFSDLSLRIAGASLLPDYGAVIFDEAHALESVASEHLGIGVSSSQIDFMLNRLYNDSTSKGLLTTLPERFNYLLRMVDRCRYRSSDFFNAISDSMNLQPGKEQRAQTPSKVENALTPLLREIAEGVDHAGSSMRSEEERKEFSSAAERLSGLCSEIEAWQKHGLENAVYWAESQLVRGRYLKTTLSAAPIDVSDVLKTHLFQKVRSVVLTSATLSVGNPPGFEFVAKRLGVGTHDSAQLGSPFNYSEQAKLILLKGMPDPAMKVDYERAVCEMAKRYILRTRGKAFLLFTSNESLRGAARALKDWLQDQQMELFVQGDGLSPGQLLERFKKSKAGVLLGTDSFWQGVDVQGEALVNVIITKLPFSVPDRPLTAARLDDIKKRGGNPFRDYSLPEAAIKLKQGFGRLIRSSTDHGIVVILDPRMLTKSYGALLRHSLPNCPVVVEEFS